MSKIQVLAGDFPKSDGRYSAKSITLYEKWWMPWGKRFKLKRDFESLEEVTEDTKVRVGAALGWGTLGSLALGPVGALAGALLGGHGKTVVFAGKLKDGRKFLAKTDSKTFLKIRAELF